MPGCAAPFRHHHPKTVKGFDIKSNPGLQGKPYTDELPVIQNRTELRMANFTGPMSVPVPNTKNTAVEYA